MKIKYLAIVVLFCAGHSEPVLATLDDNQDGMSDVWQAKYGAEHLNVDDDSDGDGESNKSEAIAGTDPLDSYSLLRVEGFNYYDDVLVLRWIAGSGVRCHLDHRESSSSSWQEIKHGLMGTGTLQEILLESGGESIDHYRLRVEDKVPYLAWMIEGIGENDSDGDGQNDLTEFLKRTDPLDKLSNSRVVDVRKGKAVRISWRTEMGKQYSLEKCNLMGGNWVRVGNKIKGLGTMSQKVIQVESGETCFYRVNAEDIDTDLDGLNDWEERALGFDPKAPVSVPRGLRDFDEGRKLLNEGVKIQVVPLSPVLNLSSLGEARMKIKRVSGAGEILVNVSYTGDVTEGEDVAELPEVIKLEMGQSELEFKIKPLPGAPDKFSTLRVSFDVDGQPLIEVDIAVIHEKTISVADYGARGDGLTDDTASIQAALDALAGDASMTTLYFPAGKYMLKSYFSNLDTHTGDYGILKFGHQDLAGRDIIIRGQNEAIIYSDVSPTRAHLLLLYASFRSIKFEGIKFEQSSTPMNASRRQEPNGADAISLIRWDRDIVESVAFANCEFTNCHGAIFTYRQGYDVRGKLRSFLLENCKVMNPYGINTHNSANRWGGGQQVNLNSWVGNAEVAGCYFDGGGDDMTDRSVIPIGIVKDGGVFGTVLQMSFHHNVVRRMGAEAFMIINDTTYAGVTESNFIMPAADGESTVDLLVRDDSSTFEVGRKIIFRLSGEPGRAPQNNLMEVVSWFPGTKTVTVRNSGFETNLEAGTMIQSGLVLFFDDKEEPAFLNLYDSVFDGSMPPGAEPLNPAGIGFNARSKISGNWVSNYNSQILIYDEVHTPLHPANRGSVVSDNYLQLPETGSNPTQRRYGINCYAEDVSIVGNTVHAINATHFSGYALRANNIRCRKNRVIASNPIFKSYPHPLRTVGYAMRTGVLGSILTSNLSMNMDLGVGSDQPYVVTPFTIENHSSIDDKVAVD